MLLVCKTALVGSAALLLLGGPQALAQAPDKETQNPRSQSSQSNPQKRPTMQQTIVVTAKLTPEELEDHKINDFYQAAYKLQEQHDYAGAIDKYRSVVIPMAEQAKFDVPRNKFLFLSYRNIGDCHLSTGHHVQAEEAYSKLFDYAFVWPGTNDSAFPLIYTSIALARMGQQNWQGAEESLQKAVAILDQQIESAPSSDSDQMQSLRADRLRMQQDQALDLLAIVYFREQRPRDALILLERAYNQAMKYKAPTTMVKTIVEDGLVISTAVGDTATTDIWFQRTRTLKSTSQ